MKSRAFCYNYSIMFNTLKAHRFTVLSLVILMIIFSFSLQAGSDSDVQSGWVVQGVISLFKVLGLPTTGYPLAFYVRKVAHFSEYFVFGLSLVLSAKEQKKPQLLGYGFLIPIMDESLQAFVPQRVASLIDIGIDGLGLGLGLWLMHFILTLRSKRL